MPDSDAVITGDGALLSDGHGPEKFSGFQLLHLFAMNQHFSVHLGIKNPNTFIFSTLFLQKYSKKSHDYQ